jgi:hypothetical protein
MIYDQTFLFPFIEKRILPMKRIISYIAKGLHQQLKQIYANKTRILSKRRQNQKTGSCLLQSQSKDEQQSPKIIIE